VHGFVEGALCGSGNVFGTGGFMAPLHVWASQFDEFAGEERFEGEATSVLLSG
jgi:hypothetical protein